MFRWGLGAGILVMIAFVIGLRWGITGVAASYAAASLVLLYPSFAIPFRLIDLSFVRMAKMLVPAFLNSILMYIALTIMMFSLPSPIPDPVVLALGIAVGLTVYVLGSWLTNQNQIKELWGLIWMRRRELNDVG